MKKVVIPGTYLCVDELMSQWKGLEAEYLLNGCPHVTKVKTKPKGVGMMAKATADAASKVIIFLEVVEEKDDMKLKKYCQRSGQAALDPAYAREELKLPHTVATTLRLVQNWFGSWRIVVGDSWFGSLPTAVQLKLKGLYCTMMIKTAHKGFPKTEFQEWFAGHGRRVGTKAKRRNDLERGSSKYYYLPLYHPGRRESIPVIAVGWADTTLKMMISTRGHTQEGVPSQRKRHRIEINNLTGEYEQKIIEYDVKTNYIVSTYFDAFPAVDISDHYRQGILGIETNWVTKKFYIRLFSTILGVIFTNAYLAYKFENNNKDALDFRAFLGKLAYSLINNEILVNEHNLRSRAENQVCFILFFFSKILTYFDTLY